MLYYGTLTPLTFNINPFILHDFDIKEIIANKCLVFHTCCFLSCTQFIPFKNF